MSDLPTGPRQPVDAIPAPEKPYRIAFFGKTKRHTVPTGNLARGFRQNGHKVLWLRPGRLRRVMGGRAAAALMRWRMRRFGPDMVLVFARDVPLEVFDAVPPQVPRAVFYPDTPREPNPAVLELGRRSSVFFAVARGYVEELEALGLRNVVFVPEGCDPLVHYPVQPDRAWAADVAFIGGVTPEFDARSELLTAIAERYFLALYGTGWRQALGRRPRREHVYPRQYRKICASTKIMIGIDQRQDLDLYFSNRTWITLGCGGFLLTRYVPNLEELFRNHVHLVWFNSTEECLDLMAHYLPREDERRRIAAAGGDYVRTYHTFRHRAARIIEHVLGQGRR